MATAWQQFVDADLGPLGMEGDSWELARDLQVGNRVIQAAAREPEARRDVFGFQIGKLCQNLMLGKPGRE